MTPALAHTPLHAWHKDQGARLVDFAGWSMPVQYTSIVAEHVATRTAASVFDISHMGRLRFDGDNAAAFLDHLLTRRVTDMEPGQIRYALLTNDQGGILDDVLVYHLESPHGARYFLLVVNASNRGKVITWTQSQLAAFPGVTMQDRTTDTAMIALQGPAALEIIDPLLDSSPANLKYYTGVVTRQMKKVCIVSRTGYTGEDGCELIIKASEAVQVWNNLLMAGRDRGCIAAGLGARDTLRLEAGMPLYGHELNEEINPFQAGLGFAVNLAEREFVGHEKLRTIRETAENQRRVGLSLSGRRVPRENYPVLNSGQQVGHVTSGTFSPTLNKPIAMAYINAANAESDHGLEIDIRGKPTPATLVPLPFYSRNRK